MDSLQCNGNHPSCSRCLDRSIPCVYTTDDDARGTAPKAYVRLLQARVSVLEQILWLHSIDVDSSAAQLLEQNAIPTCTAPLTAAGGEPTAFDHLCEAFEGTLALDEPLNFDRDGEARYFGSTSGRLDLTPSDATDGNPMFKHNPGPPHLYQELPGDEPHIAEELESHLIDLYFTWEQPWCQVVNERLFRESRKVKGRYFSPLLLNCILAAGSRYSDRPEVRSDPDDSNTAGRTFLEAAEVLFHFDIKRPTITTLQSLAILGTVQSGKMPPAGYIKNALITLSQILEKILLNLYAPKRLTLEGQRRAFFDSSLLALKSWQYGLPAELKPVKGGTPNTFPQAYTLSMVYHTATVLLAKPYITETTGPKPIGLPRQQCESTALAQKASAISLDAARQICLLGDQYREQFDSFRKSPITATHCALSAILTLLHRGQTNGPKAGNVEMDKVESGLRTLQELSTSWIPARRYHSHIERMLQERGTSEPGRTPAFLPPFHLQRIPPENQRPIGHIDTTEGSDSATDVGQPDWVKARLDGDATIGGFFGQADDIFGWMSNEMQMDMPATMSFDETMIWAQLYPGMQGYEDAPGHAPHPSH
ncbi:uncharacterized protein DNG_09907 [Cephalotrichum gorgonifer]|uniref:Transcription factor domain-containing protein n=1 Tax=Cephalotrichum gorgonifer TaxID=2041049 RepID=A0AAE8SZV0_9PEZI|nr:uncharacterized protein DNG_09907 [Cephalotrichum gorgonifer]